MPVVGPNKAVIICGGVRSKKKKIAVADWVFKLPFLSNHKYLLLTLMTLKPICNQVETLEGVPLTVSGIAQCKIINTPKFLLIAAEQFLGKKREDIETSILLTLEGHLRSILGTLTVEEIFKDREKFASLVREVATPDVAKMGIQIVSFVIKDIFDDVGYLGSLGKTRIAKVKRDAAIGVAFANRDAGIREAKCEKESSDVKYATLSKIENYSRIYNLKRAEFVKEINTAKAEALLAYELRAAQLRQEIRKEQIEIEIVERRKTIEIEEMEIERKERELTALIKLPSDAESYRIQTIAEGEKTNLTEQAIGESVKIKKLGECEARRIRNFGLKEALRMELKAKAFQEYGDAAISDLILQKLPEITSKISAPLAKIDEIVLLGEKNSLVNDINVLAGQLPPAISALSSINILEIIQKKIT